MKKIVLVSQKLNGYADEIVKAMEEVLNCKVLFIENRYGYKNIWEKLIGNLIYKPFFKKNYKLELYTKENIKRIKEFGDFDQVLFINPEGSSEGIIKYLKNFKKPMRAHYWDSFKFMEDMENFVGYFDYKSSFDPEDSKNYEMKFLPNFYIERLVKNRDKKYDYFTVMLYDERFEKLEKIADYLKDNGKSYLFIVVDRERKGIKSDRITVVEKSISIEKVYEYMNMSRGVVEIGRTHRTPEGENLYQGGLTFRAMESIGIKGKLITDYEIIKNYDFYNKRNIEIVSDRDNYKLDKEFCESEYLPLSKEIQEKYSLSSWIKNIFKEE